VIGDPTTMVLAKELSVAGILAGVRAGRTVVKLHTPADPMIVLDTVPPLPLDSSTYPLPPSATQFTLTVTVTGAAAQGDFQLRLVKDGVAGNFTAIKTDPFVQQFVIPTPLPRANVTHRWRAEVHKGGVTPFTITNHVYVKF